MKVIDTDVLKRLQSRTVSKSEFNFDQMLARPLFSYISQFDVDQLYNIATSVRYAGNPLKKYKAIDNVLNPRGFVKLSAGTNRICYRHLDDTSIVLKVAADSVAMKDNPAEFINQNYLKPFCTKVFEVSGDGAVALVERVKPIRNREEYISVADDDFALLWMITQKYVMADIGSHYFMNKGIRRGFGLVLLDFPYLYQVDGNKLICRAPNKNEPSGICGGLIDYDDGFNHLICKKCGTVYRAIEISKSIANNKIIKEGNRKKMKVSVYRYGVKISKAEDTDGLLPSADYMKHEEKPVEEKRSNNMIKVSVRKRTDVNNNVNKVKVNVPTQKPVEEPKVEEKKVEEVKTEPVKTEEAPKREIRNPIIYDANPSKQALDNRYKYTRQQHDNKYKKDYNNHHNSKGGPNITAVTFSQLKNIDFKFKSYDAENHIMFFDSPLNDAVIHIDTSSIPDEVLELLHPVDGNNEELEKTKQDLMSIEDKYINTKNENEGLKKQNEDLRQENSMYEEMINKEYDQPDKVNELTKQNEDLQKQLDELKGKNNIEDEPQKDDNSPIHVIYSDIYRLNSIIDDPTDEYKDRCVIAFSNDPDSEDLLTNSKGQLICSFAIGDQEVNDMVYSSNEDESTEEEEVKKEE